MEYTFYGVLGSILLFLFFKFVSKQQKDYNDYVKQKNGKSGKGLEFHNNLQERAARKFPLRKSAIGKKIVLDKDLTICMDKTPKFIDGKTKIAAKMLPAGETIKIIGLDEKEDFYIIKTNMLSKAYIAFDVFDDYQTKKYSSFIRGTNIE